MGDTNKYKHHPTDIRQTLISSGTNGPIKFFWLKPSQPRGVRLAYIWWRKSTRKCMDLASFTHAIPLHDPLLRNNSNRLIFQSCKYEFVTSLAPTSYHCTAFSSHTYTALLRSGSRKCQNWCSEKGGKMLALHFLIAIKGLNNGGVSSSNLQFCSCTTATPNSKTPTTANTAYAHTTLSHQRSARRSSSLGSDSHKK